MTMNIPFLVLLDVSRVPLPQEENPLLACSKMLKAVRHLIYSFRMSSGGLSKVVRYLRNTAERVCGID